MIHDQVPCGGGEGAGGGGKEEEAGEPVEDEISAVSVAEADVEGYLEVKADKYDDSVTGETTGEDEPPAAKEDTDVNTTTAAVNHTSSAATKCEDTNADIVHEKEGDGEADGWTLLTEDGEVETLT